MQNIIKNGKESNSVPLQGLGVDSPLGGEGIFYHFTFSEVAPTFAEILDFIKSTNLEEEHPAIVFIKEVLPQLNLDTGISGYYILKNLEELRLKDGLICIENIEFNLGRQLCGYIKEATQVALFVCTAGEYFTQLTNRLNEQGDIMEAYILDAIGSLTVEKAMDKIQESLKIKMLEKELKISNRYSPGYCNWPLSDQQNLFQLIGENPTGIALSDSCLMTPRKSVSGLIGLGKNLKLHEYGCKICNNTTCIYRRILHE